VDVTLTFVLASEFIGDHSNNLLQEGTETSHERGRVETGTITCPELTEGTASKQRGDVARLKLLILDDHERLRMSSDDDHDDIGSHLNDDRNKKRRVQRACDNCRKKKSELPFPLPPTVTSVAR
jgi:hypothetical protein